MTISNFVAYVKQLWKNKPDTSTPLSAERLLHMESGIKGNSDAIEQLAAAVVSQIANDPNKIASLAALYAVNQKIGDTAQLPAGTNDLVSAFNVINTKKLVIIEDIPYDTFIFNSDGHFNRLWSVPSGYILKGFIVRPLNGMAIMGGYHRDGKNLIVSGASLTLSGIEMVGSNYKFVCYAVLVKINN